jgi:hypothetical protein
MSIRRCASGTASPSGVTVLVSVVRDDEGTDVRERASTITRATAATAIGGV